MSKRRPKISKEDAVKLRLLRQQYTANENARLYGMINENEYQNSLNKIGIEIVMLEEKYGLYEQY